MNNHPFFIALFAILLNHVNKHGKCLDAIICKELAEYIHNGKFKSYGSLLWEFIDEYGIPEDSEYIGRDQYGEKQYITHNQDAHWHAMICKELGKLGHYNTRTDEEVAAMVCVYTMGQELVAA